MKRKRELTPRSETFERSELAVEKCRNPWDGTRGNTDIALYIFYEGSRLPICRNRWNDLASKNIEWRYD